MDLIGKSYRTAEVARLVGMHPNTVRMYEGWGLITKPVRKQNGYRVFTQLHIDQFCLARTAFQIAIIQNGLREKAVNIVKLTALCEFDEALNLTGEYISTVETEISNANEAVRMVQNVLGGVSAESVQNLKRKDVSDLLGISMDTLRNWEMNGLLKVKRKENGYRVYTAEDIKRLKIIRTLKCANYSLSAILRMLGAAEGNPDINVGKVLNSPEEDETIISACDKLLISLNASKENALLMKAMLLKMKTEYSNPPL